VRSIEDRGFIVATRGGAHEPTILGENPDLVARGVQCERVGREGPIRRVGRDQADGDSN